MGNKNYSQSFRGCDDLSLKAVINTMSEDDYSEFLIQAEGAGLLTASDYAKKSQLIDDLSTFDESLKTSIYENFKAGKGPFEY